MSDSNRGIRFAVIALALANCPYQGDAAQRDTGNSGKAVAKAKGIPASEQKIAAPSPKPNLTEPASEKPDYARQDLEAQQIMAWWTRAMGVAAIIGVILSGVGVLLIYTTFKATLRAARYAGVAARQSRQSLAVIKESSAAQLRPYVAITEAGEIDKNPAPFNRQSEIAFKVKNFGQTPAQNVRLWVGDDVAKEPIKDTPICITKRFGDYGSIAPNDHRTQPIHARDFNLDELADIAVGKAKLVLRLRVDYTWPSGCDSHEITMILDDPATNRWQVLDERRRLHGPMR